IIGTGMAGITLARKVCKLDSEITMHLITGDDGSVYSKPMLSNAMAQGKTADALVQTSAEQFGADVNATIWVHTRVTAINRTDKAVIVDGPNGRDVIGYGNLILAVGANTRRYTVEGHDTAVFAAVNNLDDYTHWREGLEDGGRVLIVGAGLIGMEFANDLAVAGYRVDVVDPAAKPLSRLLPDELGHVMQEALQDIGVRFHMGTVVSGVEGTVAHLSDGTKVAFNHALAAIGLRANTTLAQASGLSVEQGIVVDAQLHTSDPDIYALGDCAQTAAGVLPFILPLMAQARALAQTLTGTPTRLHLPALPVAVKTPALPAVVCPPHPKAEGNWHVEGTRANLRAVFVGPEGQSLGFALTGSQTKARQALAREMPHLLAA
ncbi:MAG: FAD-dependent oxidoreductase, partial [Magnetovibrio sp.]|nr:FAD-dependent oxidoreductase [Magnetovibrio sp.]